MHAPTTVYFFVAKRSSHWINVSGVGPVDTRTMTFFEGDQSPDWVFSKCEEASVDEGLVNNTLQGSRLPCDADSVSTYCNQGYKARVLENGHHPHVLLLFEDLIEDNSQARVE